MNYPDPVKQISNEQTGTIGSDQPMAASDEKNVGSAPITSRSSTGTIVNPSDKAPSIASFPDSHEVAGVANTELPIIPDYEILQELGRGGMGVVYRARHLRLNRQVALKMVLDAEFASTDAKLRFFKEAETLAKIQHPGIVQIFDFGTHEGKAFLTLEYLGGGSLDKKLAGNPMPVQEAALLVKELAESVQAAHDQGIIHRDLKPANILLSPQHPSDSSPPSSSSHNSLIRTAKVSDFGLAKRLDSDLTATHAQMGTPSYMAPEQAAGRAKQVGPASDVYRG